MTIDLRAEDERAASALRDAVMSIEWPESRYEVKKPAPLAPNEIRYTGLAKMGGESPPPPWHPQQVKYCSPKTYGTDLDAVIALWRSEVEKCLSESSGEWIFWRVEPEIETAVSSDTGRIYWVIYSRFTLPVPNAS